MEKMIVTKVTLPEHSFSQSVFYPWPFPKRQILDSSKIEVFANDNFKSDKKKAEGSPKTLWEKEKLLVTSNFSLPTVFWKDSFYKYIKTRPCLGKVKWQILYLE